MRHGWTSFLCTLSLCCALQESVFADWRAGVARINITPERSQWMSGYGGRDHASEGKLTDLWAKAIVLEDPSGQRIAAVTLDLVGLDRDTELKIRNGIAERTGIPVPNSALFCSHTHTGPVIGANLKAMFSISDDDWSLVETYTAQVANNVVSVVQQAVDDLEPVTLSWSNGHATFAVNRRNNAEPDVPMLREQGLLKGPVDYDVPVLAVRTADRLKAILFGYACHATVLSFYEWSGDYPGFAMLALEERHPETQAMFWAGCGADQNPLPRREVAHAQQYGAQLADAVDDALAGLQRPISGSLVTAYNEIPLGFAQLPTRERLVEMTTSSSKFEIGWSSLLLSQWDANGSLSDSYPYPVQTWTLGDGPLWVILGGEVVVDYSLRLKAELGPDTTWVAGYANDVMAYIPSLRVLKEGGYEGGGAMLYYGLPSAWADDVEEEIISEVHRQITPAP
jgi:hypothetical protein